MVGLRDPGPCDHEAPRRVPLPLHPISQSVAPGLGPAVHRAAGAPAAPGLGVYSALCSLSQAKLGDEILDYRDLAALPKSKAIYNIDRPDMISYSPYISHSVAGRQSCHEVWPLWRAVCPRQGPRLLPPPLTLGLL